jgi:hypothetical protein
MEPEGLLPRDNHYFLELIILSRCSETIPYISTVDNFRLTHGSSLGKVAQKQNQKILQQSTVKLFRLSALYEGYTESHEQRRIVGNTAKSND